MKFRYKVSVEKWGYTYCVNGIDLDNTISRDLKAIDLSAVKIEVEPLPVREWEPMPEPAPGFIVKKIDNQGDRTLLYGDRDDYHVIAKAECSIKIGDRIIYTPDGQNFGWLIEEEDSL